MERTLHIVEFQLINIEGMRDIENNLQVNIIVKIVKGKSH